MEISNALEYLDNFWVRSGLALVLLTSLLKLLPVNILKSPAVERLMHKGINYLFILGLVSIVLGFVTFQNDEQISPSIDQVPIAAEITQTISNNTGTAMNAGENMSVNQPLPSAQDHTRSESSSIVNQRIKDNSGNAFNAGSNVSATIQEK
jgi:glucan phosphoethanolaminetransferase (alkaline phosphatase superfamily)